LRAAVGDDHCAQPLWLSVDPSDNIAELDEGSAEFISGQRAEEHIYYEYDTDSFAAVLSED
jgi:hypothetical protein